MVGVDGDVAILALRWALPSLGATALSDIHTGYSHSMHSSCSGFWSIEPYWRWLSRPGILTAFDRRHAITSPILAFRLTRLSLQELQVSPIRTTTPAISNSYWQVWTRLFVWCLGISHVHWGGRFVLLLSLVFASWLVILWPACPLPKLNGLSRVPVVHLSCVRLENSCLLSLMACHPTNSWKSQLLAYR